MNPGFGSAIALFDLTKSNPSLNVIPLLPIKYARVNVVDLDFPAKLLEILL